MPSYGRLAKAGIFWSYFRQGISWLIAIPTTIILARLLTPQEFGIAAAAVFFVQLSARLTRVGFNTALVRVKELRPEHVSSVFVFNLAASALIYVILAWSAPWVGLYFRSPQIGEGVRVAGLSFVVMAFATVPVALLRRDMRFRETAALRSVGSFTESGAAVLLAWLGLGFWSIVYGQLAGSVAQTISALYMARWRPSLRFSRGAMRELFSFGIGTYVVRFLDYAAGNLDNLVVGRLLGVTALGYYDKAFSIVFQLVGRINAAGPGVSFRIFALIHEDRERFRRAYRKVVLTATLVGYPVLAGLFAVAPQLFLVLFGRIWLPAVPPFRLLCLAGMLKLLNEYADSAAQAAGWVWTEVWRQALYIVLILGGIALFAPWGITGAASAVLGATIVMFFLMQSMIKRAAGLGWRDLLQPQWPALLCSVGMVALLFATDATLNAWLGAVDPRILLMSQIVAGAAFYIGFLWLSRFPEVRALVDDTLADVAPGFARTARLWT